MVIRNSNPIRSNPRIRRKPQITIRTAASITRPPILTVTPPFVPVVAGILRRLQARTRRQGREELRGGLLPLEELNRQPE